jgi:hypothetical protein
MKLADFDIEPRGALPLEALYFLSREIPCSRGAANLKNCQFPGYPDRQTSPELSPREWFPAANVR